MKPCDPKPKASVWAKHAARYSVVDDEQTLSRPVPAPTQDSHADLGPALSASERTARKRAAQAARKRAYRASMKPLSDDDWKRIKDQAEKSARMNHESARHAAYHAQSELATLGYRYPIAPIVFSVRRALNADRPSKDTTALKRFRHAAPEKVVRETEPPPPELLTVEFVTLALERLAFPGGTVGIEGRFNWLYESRSRLKSVLYAARRYIPGAELTEFGVRRDAYGMALYFSMQGEKHIHRLDHRTDILAEEERVYDRAYRISPQEAALEVAWNALESK